MSGDDVIVMIDVGKCMTQSPEQIYNALQSMVASGMIGPFRVSEEGFNVRQIGVDQNRRECSKLNFNDKKRKRCVWNTMPVFISIHLVTFFFKEIFKKGFLLFSQKQARPYPLNRRFTAHSCPLSRFPTVRRRLAGLLCFGLFLPEHKINRTKTGSN